MNFIKRGFLGITRRLGKSFILLAAIFILGNIISGAISIQQATGNVEAVIKDRLGTSATIEIDMEALDELSHEEMATIDLQEIGVDLIEEVGALPYVKYFDYNMNTYLGSESLKSYDYHPMGDDIAVGGSMMDFQLKGINYAPVLDFEEGEATLVDGRTFTQEEVDEGTYVGILSNKVAELNDVQVGDTIVLNNEVYTFDETGGEEIASSRDVALEVIGIFEPETVADEQMDDPEMGMFDFMNIQFQNTIYVPNQIVVAEERFQIEEYMKHDEYAADLIEEDISFEYYIPLYVLNNMEDGEAFVEEATPLLPEFYTIIRSTDQYDHISGPMDSMSNIAKYVLIAAIFATVLITGLVVLLFLRDRKHELGIYLSLGERRSRVIGQVLIEVMVIAVIGITLSLFSGNLLADQLSDTLIQMGDSEDHFGDFYYHQFQTHITTEDVIDSYEVKLSPNYMLGFYGIGLLTILISTIIPLIYIVRLNPKEILM